MPIGERKCRKTQVDAGRRMLMEIASRAGFEMSRTPFAPIVSLDGHSHDVPNLKCARPRALPSKLFPSPPIFQPEPNDPPTFLPNTRLASSLLA